MLFVATQTAHLRRKTINERYVYDLCINGRMILSSPRLPVVLGEARVHLGDCTLSLFDEDTGEYTSEVETAQEFYS